MKQYVQSRQLQMEIPKDARLILKILNDAGYEAYVVGGCVRDVLLGRKPGDWDITTSAKPEEVKRLFHATVDTGIQHGTVTVMLHHTGYEVTTYRIDGTYTDNRHPDTIAFTSDLIEDLKRRDFTINAMAYNPKCGLVDAFDGILDLEQKKIRCVGNPKERFTEDALRMLRAVRFSAQLGFDIEPETLAAIPALAENLTCISKERIRTELHKLLVSGEPWKIRLCYETQMSQYIMPWLDRMFETSQNTMNHKYDVGTHTMQVLAHTSDNPYLRWAALLHDVGKPQCKTVEADGDHFHEHAKYSAVLARDIMMELRFDNKTRDIVTQLVLHHRDHPDLTTAGVRYSIYEVGPELYPLWLELRRADIAGKGKGDKTKVGDKLAWIAKTYEQVLAAGDCLSEKALALSGKDLLAAGMKPGKEIGAVLEQLLLHVLKYPEANKREVLLPMAMELYKKDAEIKKE